MNSCCLYRRERQQQIEELLKELKRVSDEAETVKAALRSLKLKVSEFTLFAFERKRVGFFRTVLYC